MLTDASWTVALGALFITDEDTQLALKTEAEIRYPDAGQAIISQDDDSNQVFIILNGEARVELLAESGHEIWIDTLKPGAILGEIAALTAVNRSSNIFADTNMTLAVYPAKKFIDLLEIHAALGLCLSRTLAERVYHTTQRMFALSALSAPGRVYAELLRMAEKMTSGTHQIIKPTPSLTELAQRINTTRETVSRAVSGLERRGLLKRTEHGFELIDPDQLSRLMGQMGNGR